MCQEFKSDYDLNLMHDDDSDKPDASGVKNKTKY